jgi:hypothetical protein
MLRHSATPLALCGMLALSACASKYAQVPARLDLQPYGRVALVTFGSDAEHGGLSALATQRFAESVLESQTGFELMELSRSDSLLRQLPASVDPVVLAKALGERKDVPAVFVGDLKVSGVKSKARLNPNDVNLRATVSAELTVRLLSTRTGGTLWRSSSVATGTVGKVGLAGGLPSVAVRDTDEAYGEVVHNLVAEVTRDFRPTWIKQ